MLNEEKPSLAGKKLYAVVFVIVCFVTINTIAQTISPMSSCCDDGDATTWGLNDMIRVWNVAANCTAEALVTCRECVDRTRDHYLCGTAQGSKYCLEDRRNPNGPRYYALYHPIIVSTSSLSFTAPYGYGCSNPAPQTFSVSNGV